MGRDDTLSVKCPACGDATGDGARFCASCGAALQPDDGAARTADELRPVTALFADVVGSTALGERLAPDEVKALVGECVSRMSRAVEEYGGTVQAYQGDGICAYFGVPAAHEDDPERAVRAGLRIVELVGEYSRDVSDAWGIDDFDVRVGINAGQMGVGLVGARDPQAVALGDATNVAARLQSAAVPGTIVVGEDIARRLARRFEFDPLEPIAVKGRRAPVSAYRVARSLAVERPPTSRLLVDREGELERIRRAVEELRAGRGAALLLVGGAGMGKTRLLAELHGVAGDDVTWLEGQCLSYGGLSSWPFIEILRSWLGAEKGEAEIAVRTKARAKLGALLGRELEATLPALGRLLRIRLDPELEERVQLPPDQLLRELRRAYMSWIEALTRERPVVVALEDVHWADAPTRELAEELLALTDRAPLLLATTLIPDPSSEGWRFRLHVLAQYAHRAVDLSLGALPESAARELLAALVPGVLDAATEDELVRRAEGNPLYLEELLRAVVEGDGRVRRRRTFTITAGAADLLPPALESLLVARIDRLPPEARRLAQLAAVLGRTFPVRVLEAIAATETFELDFPVLLRAEIIRELRRYPDLECAFGHRLLQEAALSTLTPPRRRELFSRAASAFEQVYAGRLEDHLERLAHYYGQSEDLTKAVEYLQRAAAWAIEAGAPEYGAELAERARLSRNAAAT